MAIFYVVVVVDCFGGGRGFGLDGARGRGRSAVARGRALWGRICGFGTGVQTLGPAGQALDPGNPMGPNALGREQDK